MPDADYARQDQLSRGRSRAERRLLALMSEPYDSVMGTLRDLLAPQDTLAFPPYVLSTPVETNYDEMGRTGDAGFYANLINRIFMNPRLAGHRGRGPYETLLHEAAHSRQYSQRLSKHPLISDAELNADDVADSLLRGYTSNFTDEEKLKRYYQGVDPHKNFSKSRFLR